MGNPSDDQFLSQWPAIAAHPSAAPRNPRALAHTGLFQGFGNGSCAAPVYDVLGSSMHPGRLSAVVLSSVFKLCLSVIFMVGMYRAVLIGPDILSGQTGR